MLPVCFLFLLRTIHLIMILIMLLTVRLVIRIVRLIVLPIVRLMFLIVHMPPSGVIRAVAANQCGGELQLDQAIKDGDIVEGCHNGRRLYFFPSVRVRDLEAGGTEQLSGRSKAIKMSAHQDIGLATSDVSYQLVRPHQMSLPAGASDELISMDDLSRASAAVDELTRGVTAAEQLLGKIDLSQASFRSKIAQTLLSTLQDALPSALSLRDDLRFASKFKRDRANKPLTSASLSESCDVAEAQVQELGDLVGSLRGMGRGSRM